MSYAEGDFRTISDIYVCLWCGPTVQVNSSVGLLCQARVLCVCCPFLHFHHAFLWYEPPVLWYIWCHLFTCSHVYMRIGLDSSSPHTLSVVNSWRLSSWSECFLFTVCTRSNYIASPWFLVTIATQWFPGVSGECFLFTKGKDCLLLPYVHSKVGHCLTVLQWY